MWLLFLVFFRCKSVLHCLLPVEETNVKIVGVQFIKKEKPEEEQKFLKKIFGISKKGRKNHYYQLKVVFACSRVRWVGYVETQHMMAGYTLKFISTENFHVSLCYGIFVVIFMYFVGFIQRWSFPVETARESYCSGKRKCNQDE